MLDEEFKKQHAIHVRELAEKSIDPFIKQRLLRLAERYETDERQRRKTATFIDLQFASKGNGPER